MRASLKRLGYIIAFIMLFISKAPAGVCDAAMAIPFVCVGQTAMTSTEMFNPTPNRPPGLIGACPALPFVVPTGKILVINAMHLEGMFFGMDMSIFLGSEIPRKGDNTRFLASLMTQTDASAKNAQPSNQFTELNYRIASGTVVNLWLRVFADRFGYVAGWDFTGCLIPENRNE